MNLNRGYGLDANGYIVSDVSKDKMNTIYLNCIQESVDGLKRLFHQHLHSVYVYGSVARGDAIIKKSDLDLIALFDCRQSSIQLDALKKLAEELSEKYRSLFRDVGIAAAYYDYTVDPANYYENAFLKELCICVHGEDLGERFGPYKLTPEIAISFNGDIKESHKRALKRLDKASKDEFKTYTQGFARKLIRTYYSMVMVRSQIWTTRLQEQSKVFTHFFPEKETTVQTLLDWIKEPPMDRKTVYDLFKSEGEWASEHFLYEAKTF